MLEVVPWLGKCGYDVTGRILFVWCVAHNFVSESQMNVRSVGYIGVIYSRGTPSVSFVDEIMV